MLWVIRKIKIDLEQKFLLNFVADKVMALATAKTVLKGKQV